MPASAEKRMSRAGIYCTGDDINKKMLLGLFQKALWRQALKIIANTLMTALLGSNRIRAGSGGGINPLQYFVTDSGGKRYTI